MILLSPAPCYSHIAPAEIRLIAKIKGGGTGDQGAWGPGSPKISQGHQNQMEGEGEQVYSDGTVINTHLV